MTTVRTGQCLCGSVRYTVRGEPRQVGICHCTDCRQETGSAFNHYAIWPVDQFESNGETTAIRGRHGCAQCGTRLFALDDDEAEIRLGSLAEAPTPFRPTYELWVKRREPWLPPVPGAEQYVEDRT